MPIALLPAPSTVAVLYDNTAGGSIASWDVTSGLTGYNHLRLVVLARSDVGAQSYDDLLIRFNNDSGAAQYQSILFYAATGAAASQYLAQTALKLNQITGSTATANHFSSYEATIVAYSQTTAFKVIHGHGYNSGGTGNLTEYYMGSGGVWLSTAAITRITVLAAGGNLIAGSRLTIYGM